MNIKNDEQNNNFNAINLKLASPEKIKEWSFGEVTRPETINYRTQRSERGGLFDERIFGPEKDYECYCGKYRRIRYKDIVCEKCGVEVTRSIVRRERMGHIELASPVAHIWFLRGIPSRIGIMADLSIADLEKVIYFAGYVVTKVNDVERQNVLRELDREFKTKIKSVTSDEAVEKIKDSFAEVKREISMLRKGVVLDENAHHKFSIKYGSIFESDIGAEALYKIFKNIDLPKLAETLEEKLEDASAAEKGRLQKRLNLTRYLIGSNLRPEWMFLKNIPIIPPALRPMVALEGGRHATSDVNDLYRRVINRNNRLKKLMEINAPDVIQRNEKRIMQEAIDALIDNSIRHTAGSPGAMSQSQRRPLKSLADILKGKQGRFRQNLLGKRVDYSGRSVIIVGPDLALGECGLPKHMALELFRPFVISKILERELAFNIRGAGRLIEDGVPEVWEILEDVIKDKYVLLNRAPTLHRLGIQAFRPILIEGNAIQIHPLVCSAFNADFDGDQMAVHVPLGDEAQREAREIMASNKNLLKPGSGDPVVTPRHDMVLGCYWMTKMMNGERGEGMMFQSPNAAITVYEFGHLGFRAKVKIMASDTAKYGEYRGRVMETTVGRILFNSILPIDLEFMNQEITGKEISKLIEVLIERYGPDAVPEVLDKIKHFGYKYCTKSGITLGMSDIQIPPGKKDIVSASYKLVNDIKSNFEDGLLSEDERYKMTVGIWRTAWNDIQKLVPEALDPKGSIYDMAMSRARGTIAQISQMSGMKGLIINSAGRTLDFPVIPSYKEGLSPLEYFTTTHGARKGLADTALNTSKAGYLTRRLVDVAQDVIISEEDCGDKEGRVIAAANLSGIDAQIGGVLKGRILAKDLKDVKGDVIFKKNTLLSKYDAKAIDEKDVREGSVRSPLTCKSVHGICQACYGLDLGTHNLIKLGEAVGIVAAQAIGEPGTQLTMRTFHSGGVSEVGGDITMGLPRVEEIFEKRAPKSAAVIAEANGEIMEIKLDGKDKTTTLLVDASDKKNHKEGSIIHAVPFNRTITIKVGQRVAKGDILTDGSANITDLFRLGGRVKAEDYILNEISKIYSMQGAAISRKHIEVIIRQMLSRMRVTDVGESNFVTGQIIEHSELILENKKLKRDALTEAKAELLILGVSEVSLTTTSWLSAASFQNTSRILIDTAIQGGTDELRGLKENVIIGRLIPAGTGFRKTSSDKDEEAEADDGADL
ncbi:MAG: DNA-directed RNA polymerase subunit beta' [Candidatus Vogelbacteria bacterium]|nr:DNA-directed RNA polymerase subunit beta' [Candidatus Vogelbacteria bacterium]